ncbi:MAG TPA: hypothetical protein VN039_03935 [Nitrospira sp.]|nr:hypothetical protein [Nitrospira sp.]
MDRPHYVHLYDGGPIDNLGIQAVVEYLNRNILGTTLDRLFPKGCLIIAIDATPASELRTSMPEFPVGNSRTISSTRTRLMRRMPC